MQQIREILDEPLLQAGFVYDEAIYSYTKTWEGLENVHMAISLGFGRKADMHI